MSRNLMFLVIAPIFCLAKPSSFPLLFKEEASEIFISTPCVEGLSKAKADIQKGIIGFYYWGIANSPLTKTLVQNYGCKVFNMGCSVTPEEVGSWNCYNEYMRKALKTKFRKDVIAIETKKLEDRN